MRRGWALRWGKRLASCKGPVQHLVPGCSSAEIAAASSSSLNLSLNSAASTMFASTLVANDFVKFGLGVWHRSHQKRWLQLRKVVSSHSPAAKISPCTIKNSVSCAIRTRYQLRADELRRRRQPQRVGAAESHVNISFVSCGGSLIVGQIDYASRDAR